MYPGVLDKGDLSPQNPLRNVGQGISSCQSEWLIMSPNSHAYPKYTTTANSKTHPREYAGATRLVRLAAKTLQSAHIWGERGLASQDGSDLYCRGLVFDMTHYDNWSSALLLIIYYLPTYLLSAAVVATSVRESDPPMRYNRNIVGRLSFPRLSKRY